MRYILSLLLGVSLLFTSPVFAEGFKVEINGDFTRDGVNDYAALIEAGETGEADFLLRLNGSSIEIWVDRAVWVGGVGQQPSLKITPQGSLQVISENAAIGRNRWEQVITLAYRNQELTIAGYTYRWYDTLNLADSGMCDLNLLTGKGEIMTGGGEVPERRKVIAVQTQSRPVHLWLYDMPRECATLFK